MKRLATIASVLAVLAPSVASAEPAAQALSLSNAAVQPVRAAARTDKKLKALDTTTAAAVGVVTAAGLACVIWCGGGSNSK